MFLFIVSFVSHTDCGGSFYGPAGSISSLSYPMSEPVGGWIDCQWLITVDEGHYVSLTFDDFSLLSGTSVMVSTVFIGTVLVLMA